MDQYVLGVFERIAHMAQRTFGINNFLCGRLCYMAFALASLVVEEHIAAIQAVIIMMVFVRFFEIERKISQNLKPGVRNPLSLSTKRFIAVRCAPLSIAIVAVPLSFEASLTLFALGVWTYLCFISCTPLPPGESKVRQWVRSLRSVRIAIPQPTTG
jgi:hypothetical protein